nr:ATP-binding cassette domain-containing protein [Desulfofarcimen acetoxidans]
MLGVNGSGKSTLLKCLNKLLKPLQRIYTICLL